MPRERREVERREIAVCDDLDVDCIRCGKRLTLYWNGGELDDRSCCGLDYRQEHARTDLVISEMVDAPLAN